MFVVSVKTNRKKVYLFAALVLLLALILVAAVVSRGGSQTAMAAKYSLRAETNEERIAFLKQFGWEVTAEPLEITEVTIPHTFNEVYEKYNEIQKRQDMDLTPYAGKICKQWVYQVENYPDQNQNVRATLLVFKGKVIGGDISSAALNGFMCGFHEEGGDQGQPELAMPSEAPQASSTLESQLPSEIPTAAWPID